MSDGRARHQRIFDGHNDALMRLWRAGDATGEGFVAGRNASADAGHLDAPRARAGGLAGGFFAMFPPDQWALAALDRTDPDSPVNVPYIPPIDPSQARRAVFDMAAILLRIDRTRPDVLRLCRSAAEIEAAADAGALAAILHLEGAEAIGPDLSELELLYAAGLRSLGPVWSRPNIFGYGVPFRFPADPDDGPGLTPLGRALVEACDALGVMLDVSHLNAAGFWDVAQLSEQPLVATHSNAHALCPSARNLTDAQLDAIAERRGLVGVNFAVGFLRPDGAENQDTPLDLIVRHLDHLLAKLGEDGVALGSDFDGAPIPNAIGDVAGLPALVAAMRAAGYGDALVEKICWGNWVSLLRRTLGG